MIIVMVVAMSMMMTIIGITRDCVCEIFLPPCCIHAVTFSSLSLNLQVSYPTFLCFLKEFYDIFVLGRRIKVVEDFQFCDRRHYFMRMELLCVTELFK